MSDLDLFDTQRQFIVAVAEHFGLPADCVMQSSKIQGGADCKCPFEVALVVALRPADLSAVVERMRQIADRQSVEALNKFLDNGVKS